MIQFTPWKIFRALYDRAAVRAFVQDTADSTAETLEKGMRSGTKSGFHYRGYPNRSSAPGEYPAVQSGVLVKSIKQRVTNTEATVGTTDIVGFWMREGTTNMAPRRMSDAAMKEALPGVRSRMRNWAIWKR